MTKRLQTYEGFVQKINETGEWSRGIDWQYVKDNPESTDRDDQAAWIKALADSLEEVQNFLGDGAKMEIEDIRGFDNYQGPYAWVNINGKKFKVWTMEYDDLWIEDFPIDNTSDDDKNPGFQGQPIDVADAITDYCSQQTTPKSRIQQTDPSGKGLSSDDTDPSGKELLTRAWNKGQKR